MKINIVTLFPDFFSSPLKESLLGKCIDSKNLVVNLINLRNYAVNKHGQVDDAVYGGGSGMLLMIEPIYKALHEIKNKEKSYIILLSASGRILGQEKIRQYYDMLKTESEEKFSSITVVCGHFEGVDERVAEYLADEEISLGKFVLSGGEPAALVIVDALARLLPGFMGNPESLKEESYDTSDYLEYPQYTRPADFMGMKVPEILLSGNHKEIEKWRKSRSIERSQLKKALEAASKID